jgi:hypothetical protein
MADMDSAEPGGDKSTETLTTDAELHSAGLPYLKVFLLVMAAWAIMGILPLLIWLSNNGVTPYFGIANVKWSTLGSIGDMFGAANSLFAGVALLVAVFTVTRFQAASIRNEKDGEGTGSAS